MAVNGIGVGHDATITIYDNLTRQILATANITGFDEKAEMTEIKSRPLSGLPIYGYIPEGWKGTFEMDRTTRFWDDYFANQESAYYAGQAILSLMINRFVNEPDGTVSVYRHVGVAIKPADMGSWRGDSKVTQKFDWASSTRIRV